MERRHTRVLAGAACCAVLAATPACTLLNSFSESSGSVSSISESVSDSSTSSSSSSGGDSAALEIEREVRHYTARQLERGAGATEWLRGVGALCEEHGLTNWEEVPGVYRGIGAGLAESAVPESEAREFATLVTDGDRHKLSIIGSAYRAYRAYRAARGGAAAAPDVAAER